MTPEEISQALQESTKKIADLITELVRNVQEKRMPAHQALATLDKFIAHAKERIATFDLATQQFVQPHLDFFNVAREEIIAVKNKQN